MTSTGAMMGDPTSFPVMPLLSLRSLQVALERVPPTRHELAVIRLFGTGPIEHRFPAKLCGDDALYPMFHTERRNAYNKHFTSTGAVLSPQKSFSSGDRGLFCERPYVHGEPKHFTPISIWASPPGGSKGQTNWASQALVASQWAVDQGSNPKRGLWKFSPHAAAQAAAYVLGLPLGAPPGHGGVNHPLYPKASRAAHYQWLTFLATRTVGCLVTGTGLAILPGPTSTLRSAASEFIDQLLQEDQAFARYRAEAGVSEEDLPPLLTRVPVSHRGRVLVAIDEATERVLGGLMSWEFYFRIPTESEHTPSIWRSVCRFVRRVQVCPPIAGRYSSTAKDLNGKLSQWLAADTPLPQVATRRYGLEGTGPARPRKVYSGGEWVLVWA